MLQYTARFWPIFTLRADQLQDGIILLLMPLDYSGQSRGFMLCLHNTLLHKSRVSQDLNIYVIHLLLQKLFLYNTQYSKNLSNLYPSNHKRPAGSQQIYKTT